MDDCEHFWVNISSKRQRAWQCSHCGELRLDDPAQKREWQGLTDEEMEAVANSVEYNPLAMTVYEYRVAVQKATAAKLKEKNT